MKKLLLALVLLLLAAPAMSKSRKPDIQPFGGLKWDDGLFSAMEKVGKFKPTSIKLGIEQGNRYNRQFVFVQTIKPGAGPKEIKAAIFTALKKSYGKVKADLLPHYASSYLGSDFKTKRHFRDYWVLEVEPVNIKGVPFKLTMGFSASKGFELVRPDQVFSLKLRGQEYSFPLVLSATRLVSHSARLVENDRQRHNQIVELLKRKYGSFSPSGTSWKLSRKGELDVEYILYDQQKQMAFRSAVCSQLSLCAGGMSMKMKYSNAHVDLDKLYEKHKFQHADKQKKQIPKDAPDLGGGL